MIVKSAPAYHHNTYLKKLSDVVNKLLMHFVGKKTCIVFTIFIFIGRMWILMQCI